MSYVILTLPGHDINPWKNSERKFSMWTGVNILYEWITEDKLLHVSTEATSQLHTNKGVFIYTRLNCSGNCSQQYHAEEYNPSFEKLLPFTFFPKGSE